MLGAPGLKAPPLTFKSFSESFTNEVLLGFEDSYVLKSNRDAVNLGGRLTRSLGDRVRDVSRSLGD